MAHLAYFARFCKDAKYLKNLLKGIALFMNGIFMKL